ncbi:MAG: tRNA guanosine(34) transglycosylase Tgt, partial [Candidatus Igneacidithiobacillus chanchocoensis]
MSFFQLLARDGAARRGRLHFARGTVETPAFMPVGTYGTVKGMTPEELRELGAEILLGNTFHLSLRPGLEVVEALGGLHRMMHWDGPILTDSGGFQVFSLGAMRSLREAGVSFRAPSDGRKVFLGPEESMDIQARLGSDIAMVFDECTPHPADHAKARASMELSLRWAARSRGSYAGPGRLFGIVQGGMFPDLRLRSLAALERLDFPGLAIGGLSVGES